MVMKTPAWYGRKKKNPVLVGAVLLSIGQDIARKGIPAWESDGNVEASVTGCNGAKKVSETTKRTAALMAPPLMPGLHSSQLRSTEVSTSVSAGVFKASLNLSCAKYAV